MSKKILNNNILLGILVGYSLIILSMIMIKNLPSEKTCKKYIIEHQKEIVIDTSNFISQEKGKKYFKIMSTEYSYFEDITIRLNDENSYYVIFWADRDKIKSGWYRFLWKLKLDKSFEVDIKYNEYKGKNVDLDKEILKILTIHE